MREGCLYEQLADSCRHYGIFLTAQAVIMKMFFLIFDTSLLAINDPGDVKVIVDSSSKAGGSAE